MKGKCKSGEKCKCHHPEFASNFKRSNVQMTNAHLHMLNPKETRKGKPKEKGKGKKGKGKVVGYVGYVVVAEPSSSSSAMYHVCSCGFVLFEVYIASRVCKNALFRICVFNSGPFFISCFLFGECRVFRCHANWGSRIVSFAGWLDPGSSQVLTRQTDRQSCDQTNRQASRQVDRQAASPTD